MKKSLISLLILLLACSEAKPQQSIPREIDSLETLLKTQIQIDTIRICTMLALEKAFVQINSPKTGTYSDEIISMSKRLDYARGLVYGYVTKSIIALKLSDIPLALSLAYQALDIALPHKDPSSLSSCYWQLGTIHLKSISTNESANGQKAIEYFKQQAFWAYKTHNTNEIISAHQTMALALLELHKSTEALDVLYKARDVLKGKNLPINEGYVFNLIGRTLIEEGRYKTAITYLKQGEMIAERLEIDRLKILIYYHLGSAHQKLSMYDKAEAYLLKSLALVNASNTSKALPTLQALSEVNELKKDYRKALMYNKRYNAI